MSRDQLCTTLNLRQHPWSLWYAISVLKGSFGEASGFHHTEASMCSIYQQINPQIGLKMVSFNLFENLVYRMFLQERGPRKHDRNGLAGVCDLFFPTCQVRVVRFYVCCLSFLFVLLFVLLLLPYSSPDVARCYEGPPECSGQCRTSIGSSKADWAMPDLNRGAPKRTGQCRSSTGEL